MYLSYVYVGDPMLGLFSPQFFDKAWSIAKFADFLKHMIIPIVVIGLGSTCDLIHVMRGQMLDEMDKPYMLTARAKGLSETKTIMLAQISLFVLSFMYVMALFGNFVAPQGLDSYDSESVNSKPTQLHWIDKDGKFHLMPFVYGTKSGRDPITLRKTFVEDTENAYAIQFFVKGTEYKFWGVIPSNLHLFGVKAPGHFFVFGTDGMGRDLFSRVVLGSQVSLTIPLVGVFISFILGLWFGGISGYFGGTIDNIIQRSIEIIRSFPTLPLWMALSAAIPPRVPVVQMFLYIMIIMAFIEWTGLARVVRSKFISIKNEDYVMAAKILR